MRILYIILVVVLATVSIPAASAAPDFLEKHHGILSIEYEMPAQFDGWASSNGCYEITKPDDRYSGNYLLVRQGKGVTLVIQGEQTPHGYTICSYDRANYFIGAKDYSWIDSANSSPLYDPFSGITGSSGRDSSTPYSSNPFERLGYSLGGLPHNIQIRTDMLDTNLHLYSKGALLAYPTYLPLDDKMMIQVEGVHKPYVDIFLDDTDLFDFDAQKYGGNALVNGTLAPVTFHYNDKSFKVTINMTEYGWPSLDDDEILAKAKKMYHDLYGDYYMDKYGEIPIPNYESYLRGNDPDRKNQITYSGATFEIEMPLIVHDKDSHYTKSHPDLGWCRDPLVLVAKASLDLTAACVMPESAQILQERGWAQKAPVIPESVRDSMVNLMASRGLRYDPGNADPYDAFRAALLGLPHADDVYVYDTLSKASQRDKDYLRHIGDNYDEMILEHNEFIGLEPECWDYVWNSPEPKDERIIADTCGQ